jgi:hypothetical protein
MATSEMRGAELNSERSHWLLVERLENWLADEKRCFTGFGIQDRKKKLGGEIRKGDLLIFYVSDGISCLADVREAISNGIEKRPIGSDYDTPYPWWVRTAPVLTLARESWVPFKPLLSVLTFTKDSVDWRQLMRNSLRRLAARDAAIIMTLMKDAYKRPPSSNASSTF